MNAQRRPLYVIRIQSPALGETLDQVAGAIQQTLDAYAEEMRPPGKGLPAPTATAASSTNR
jgi:hypothetical protein